MRRQRGLAAFTLVFLAVLLYLFVLRDAEGQPVSKVALLTIITVVVWAPFLWFFLGVEIKYLRRVADAPVIPGVVRVAVDGVLTIEVEGRSRTWRFGRAATGVRQGDPVWLADVEGGRVPVVVKDSDERVRVAWSRASSIGYEGSSRDVVSLEGPSADQCAARSRSAGSCSLWERSLGNPPAHAGPGGNDAPLPNRDASWESLLCRASHLSWT